MASGLQLFLQKSLL